MSNWSEKMEKIRGDFALALVGERVVIRDNMAGVYMGVLVYLEGKSWALTDCRQAHGWTGAAATPGLAVRGPKGGRIGPVHTIAGEDLVSVMPCTDEAIKAWAEMAEWRP